MMLARAHHCPCYGLFPSSNSLDQSNTQHGSELHRYSPRSCMMTAAWLEHCATPSPHGVMYNSSVSSNDGHLLQRACSTKIHVHQ